MSAPVTEPSETTPAEEVLIRHEVLEKPMSTRRRIGTGVVLAVLGVLSLWPFGLALGGKSAQLSFGDVGSAGLPSLTFAAAALAVPVGVVLLVVGLYQAARGLPTRRVPLALILGFLLFVVVFLCWISARSGGLDVLGVLQNSIGYAVPLILGALAGVLCERSGVINVAIEGQMLAGAFAGALFGTLLGQFVGVVAAAVAGGLIGAMLAVFAIKYLVNQVVLGVVLNVFALGLTGFFYNAVLQTHTASLNQPGILPNINIPLLSQIPLVGPLLFQTNIIVYLTYVLIVVIDVALFRTRWGLRTRAVGEHPKAADTVGIKVLRLRYRNVMMGGAVAGIGGAYLTFSVGLFSANITSGQGFIALAAVIFGRWSPRGAVLAALFFGFTLQLQNNLSSGGVVTVIPSNFVAMLPYVATVLAVAGFVGRVRAPAADGEPYVKG